MRNEGSKRRIGPAPSTRRVLIFELAEETIVTSAPELGRVGLVLLENRALPFAGGGWSLFSKNDFRTKIEMSGRVSPSSGSGGAKSSGGM